MNKSIMNKSIINTLRNTVVGVFFTLAAGVSVTIAAPLKVVTSFSILNDLVQQVGGDKVEAVTIVGAESDAHSFEPRPSDAQRLQDADLLIINGVQFEAWLPKLIQAAGYEGEIIEASAGVPLRAYVSEDAHTEAAEHDHHHDHDHDHGVFDPHAWQSLEHAQLYVHTICDALKRIDPENKVYYQQRTADYEKSMQQLHAELLERFKALPPHKRSVVSSHDAFSYLGQAYGVEFLSLLGASNQAEPSAKELADLITYMRMNQVQAVFVENISSPKLVEQMARETGAVVGKQLYSDALAKSPHPADTYLGMMRWNAEAILEALNQ